jgi:hypothetical protein
MICLELVVAALALVACAAVLECLAAAVVPAARRLVAPAAACVLTACLAACLVVTVDGLLTAVRCADRLAAAGATAATR